MTQDTTTAQDRTRRIINEVMAQLNLYGGENIPAGLRAAHMLLTCGDEQFAKQLDAYRMVAQCAHKAAEQKRMERQEEQQRKERAKQRAEHNMLRIYDTIECAVASMFDGQVCAAKGAVVAVTATQATVELRWTSTTVQTGRTLTKASNTLEQSGTVRVKRAALHADAETSTHRVAAPLLCVVGGKPTKASDLQPFHVKGAVRRTRRGDGRRNFTY